MTATGMGRGVVPGCVLAAALAYLPCCAVGGVEVWVSDGSAESPVAEQARQGRAEAVKELLESCSVDATAWIDVERAYENARSGPHVAARYKERPVVEVAGRRVNPDEVVVPLPPEGWPEYLFVRESATLMAFAKYQPERLVRLVNEADAGLPDHLRRAYLDHLEAAR